MKKILLFAFFCFFGLHNAKAQWGEALEDGFLSLRKLFGHEEPVPVRIPEWHSTQPEFSPPKTPATTFHTADDGAIIFKDGRIITSDVAAADNLISIEDGSVRRISPSVKVINLNQEEIRVYRRYLDLPVSDGLTDIHDVNKYDEALMDAVRSFQHKKHIPETGIISGRTEILLRKELRNNELVRQQYLKTSYETAERANGIIAFQAVNHLPSTGKLDQVTTATLDRYVFSEDSYDGLINIFRRGDEMAISSFGDFRVEGVMEKLGFATPKATNAVRANQIIKFQIAQGLSKTGFFDAATGRILLEYGAVDDIIPASYKTGNKGFKEYFYKYVSDLQAKNTLEVTGKLNEETRLVIRSRIDRIAINKYKQIGSLHQDFVSVDLANNHTLNGVKFYFNTAQDDYFILDNKNIILDKLLAYKCDRNTGQITAVEISDVLSSYDKEAARVVATVKGNYTFMHCGLISDEGTVQLQIGAKSIALKKQQIDDFIESGTEIQELTTILQLDETKPLIVFRPDYTLIKTMTSDTYSSLYGTAYSSVNTAKLAAALTKRYGGQMDVYLASDIKKAMQKAPLAAISDLDPQFQIYTPNRNYFKPAFGWKLDDYHMINNLKGRAIYKDKIVSLPRTELGMKPEDWSMHDGPKMFIGHSNDDFQYFMSYYVKNHDKSPLFIVSCYDQGNEYFVSQLINQQQISNIVYFSEVIHPTAASDVIAAYYKLSSSAAGKGKPFKQLWKNAIKEVREKNATRYSDQMKAELDKLDKLIFMLTFNDQLASNADAA